MNITICALTYMRPEGAARLIKGLCALAFGDEEPDISLLIVDNDPEGSARATCEALAATSRWPLRYVIEPERGIACARNAALEHSLDADWISFIDDDEVPEPQWLDELIRAQKTHDADVVAGPVLPRFAFPIESWKVKGRFFQYTRHPDGRRLSQAYTNNVLFRTRIIKEQGLRFDKKWALMGCEDLAFFKKIHMAGYRIFWADNAVVNEFFPKSRTTARWILQRGFRLGNSASSVRLDLQPGWRTYVRLLILGCVRIAKGLFFLPLTWPFGRQHPVTYLRHMCYGAGMLAGLHGVRYEEYAKTHGS